MDSQSRSTYNATYADKRDSVFDGQWSNYYLLLLLLYPVVVALLRHDRLRKTLETFPYTTRRSFADMTDTHASEIQSILGELEFPFIFEKALQFALFRTYGIPSISKLLVATSQFSTTATAAKRYTDTVVLVREIMSFRPNEERSQEAIARMNFIHGVYQKSGKISNEDLLYTLSLFAGEPVRWIKNYEWRALEDFEICAIGTYWKSVGDAMGIDYEPLKSEAWVDGLQWMEEVTAWGESYEKLHMKPHEDNHKTANETVAILLWEIPTAAKNFGKNLVCTMMDDRLREAVMYDKPSAIYYILLSVIVTTRRYLIRLFFFPRLYMFRVRGVTDRPSKEGTFYQAYYNAAPYYVKPTLWRRWGPTAWLTRFAGLPLPGDDGRKYHPEGYKIQDVGPEIMRGKGIEDARDMVKNLRKRRTGACPFVRVKAE